MQLAKAPLGVAVPRCRLSSSATSAVRCAPIRAVCKVVKSGPATSQGCLSTADTSAGKPTASQLGVNPGRFSSRQLDTVKLNP
jgi:hypothetical protein